jgi:predicted adenine nucleotide alpha hydrolase (AANH) superfamily ATPase
LKKQNIAFSGYFFNPNIHPYKEFRKRLNSVIEYSRDNDIDLILDRDYGLKMFLRSVVFHENSRCPICYNMRLEKTAKMAIELGFNSFSTTLLYSRYQNHANLREQGGQLSEKYSVPFFYEDFRDGWQAGVDASIKSGLYRQNYCGCVYSEQERFDNRYRKKLKKEGKLNV